jgi:hypothetical protein
MKHRCRKGRRKSRSNGWRRRAVGFLQIVPRSAGVYTDRLQLVVFGQPWQLEARQTAMRWDGTCKANVAPSGAIRSCCHTPWLRRPPGASPGVMHGPALRAELGRSEGGFVRFGPKTGIIPMAMFLRRRRLTMLNPGFSLGTQLPIDSYETNVLHLTNFIVP